MKTGEKFYTVTMHINTMNHRSNNSKWDIQIERGIIQHIECPIFRFSTESVNIAVTKVADIVARHPEFYFNKIVIE